MKNTLVIFAGEKNRVSNVPATFDDFSLLQDENAVRVGYGRETVGDDQSRAVRADGIERGLKSQ